MKIPFCKTTLGIEEKKAICDVIDSGWVVMCEKTKQFETGFAKYIGAKHAVFVDSGTAALDLSLKYLIKYEKIDRDYPFEVPSLTFTATAEVVVHNDLALEFGDVNEDYCITPHLNSLPVHLMGNRAKGGALIYDSAHRIEKGDVKGSGALWCYSFYATKNITTIQGGMIATNNDEADKWLRLARDHGVTSGTTERYKKGKWEYDIEFVGWREKADDVRAAVGIEQLKKLPIITGARNYLVSEYNKAFAKTHKGNHLYPILVNDRDVFMKYMNEKEIQCSVHFLPLHKMKAYKTFYHDENLNNTEFLGEHLVSLPLYPGLSKDEMDYIIDSVLKSKQLYV